MLCAAKVEPTQMQTVNDLVQSLFTHHTRAHFFFNAMVFLANTVALLTQMFIMNDPSYEHFRTSSEAIVIYVMLAISFVCNSILAVSEIKSHFGAGDLSSLNGQNTIDMLAIVYTWVYIILRIIMPSQ